VTNKKPFDVPLALSGEDYALSSNALNDYDDEREFRANDRADARNAAWTRVRDQ